MNKKTKYCNIENDLFRFFTIIIRKELIENKWSYFSYSNHTYEFYLLILISKLQKKIEFNFYKLNSILFFI